MKIRKTLKRKDNQKGFTLVELIVVMAILVIIGAIAVPRYQATLAKAKGQANEANIIMIEKAAELAVFNGDVSPGDEGIMGALEDKGYIDQGLTNPVNGDPYIVTITKEVDKLIIEVKSDEEQGQ
ncbi:MAG: prepilin-type N-terminal cleavage/methylation domain-containing protein [Syntrophomonadaceae bacterium]|nr:prepilin-type N-terminal cleavage/methylation domain-containing protein [Syntrophomonadaceae bacterium]